MIIYWHNLNGDNDATDRSNYSTDQAGTTPAAAGSMAADDLRFDGTGAGAGDDWVISPGGTVEASTIDFTNHPLLVGTEDLAVPANRSTLIATTITNLGAGRANGNAGPLGGVVRVNAVALSLSAGSISSGANRVTFEYTGLTPKCSVAGSGTTIFARESFVLDDSTIEFESTLSDGGNYRNGVQFAAPGGQIRKTGPGPLRHQGGRDGYANVGSVDVEEGELGLGSWEADGDPTGLDPVDPFGVPITFSADTGLQLESSNNGVRWGLDLRVPALATGVHIRFTGGPQRIAAGSAFDAQEDVTLENPFRASRVLLAPAFSGSGEITLEFSGTGSGSASYRIETGGPIGNQFNVTTTTGTEARRLELSPGTEITADLGVSVLNDLVTVEEGAKLTLAASATIGGVELLGGTLDLDGFTLTVPSFSMETGAGTLVPNGGGIVASGSIVLLSGTLADPAGSTFKSAQWVSGIDAVGTAEWFVDAEESADHTAGTLTFSTAVGVPGTIYSGATDGGNNTNWAIAQDTYWRSSLGLGIGIGLKPVRG